MTESKRGLLFTKQPDDISLIEAAQEAHLDRLPVGVLIELPDHGVVHQFPGIPLHQLPDYEVVEKAIFTALHALDNPTREQVHDICAEVLKSLVVPLKADVEVTGSDAAGKIHFRITLSD